MLTTTLEELHRRGACTERYRHLCKALGGIKAYGRKTPIPLLKIMETNGFEDCLWALRAVMPEQKMRRDAVAMEFSVRCLMAAPRDPVLNRQQARYHVLCKAKYSSYLGRNMAYVAKRVSVESRRAYVDCYSMAEWVASSEVDVGAIQGEILRELLEGDGDGESV